jgi:hypothetical protein
MSIYLYLDALTAQQLLIPDISSMRNSYPRDGSPGERSTIPMRSTVRFEATSPS